MTGIKTVLLCILLLYSGIAISKEQVTTVYCTYPEHYNGQKVSVTATLADGTFRVVEAEVSNKTAIFSLSLEEPCAAYILSENNTSELHVFLDVPYMEIIVDGQEITNSVIYESKSTEHWLSTRNQIMKWNVKKDSLLNELPVSFGPTPQKTYLTDSLNRELREYIIHEIKEFPKNPVSWFLFRRYENLLSYKQTRYLMNLLKYFSGYNSYTKLDQELYRAGDANTYKNFSLPSVTGKIVRLGNFKSKYILIEFRPASSLTTDTLHNDLIPLYNNYRHKGLEIVTVFDEYMIKRHLERISQAHLPWILLLSDASVTDINSTLEYVSVPGNILLDSNFEVVLRNASVMEIATFLKAGL